ncbi:MAG: Crp/Fnr family transcriptional regulator [Elusimicrobia bacterium RIFCSPLOWO2_01_FULL_64_13]|nr:MAG: Crp/Fnr family transcriptional regulator [Elusimicrobia bacterium RIFCSPHIGHO2_01_FULL_64_10]OGR97823.1 MAG: Crp/Fnr family transcriptional regulator [Elusimicrobia bacterium RIFCSPLOWO2_01_FULL_64_13]
MRTLEPILAEHPFLEGLDSRQLQFIVGCAMNVRFNAGEHIFREGGSAEHFFFIREGKVAVEISTPERGPIVIETLGPGEVLGWSWLYPPYRWYFDARAIEMTRAIAIDGKCLRGKCEKDHDLGYEILKRFAKVIINRLQAARIQLLDLYGSRP